MSENETAKIRVAVVDDHEMFRAGVIATLRGFLRYRRPSGGRARFGGDDRTDQAAGGVAGCARARR